MYACPSCHLTYFLFWEYTYHLFVQCPNKEHWKKESSKHDFPRLPYMTSNVILMGFKGAQFLETGAVYAPYIPLIMTPLVYDPTNFTPRRGVMTRYAKKMVRPEFYGKIYVKDLASL